MHRLAAAGAIVRVAIRHPEGARSALPAADLTQVTFFRADVREPTSIAAAMAGADAVVNAVSAYVEKGGVTFESVHVQGAEAVAREAVRLGVARLVLISGLGADPQSRSPYIRSRGRGELAVQKAFPDATIVRPSAMWRPRFDGSAMSHAPSVEKRNCGKVWNALSLQRSGLLLQLSLMRLECRWM